MTEPKGKWDDIPSIGGLEVDWDYEPENPLGKRGKIRVADEDLRSLLGAQSIPVKVVAKNFEGKGYLVDIAQGGLAVSMDTELVEKQPVMVGFFLGEQKVVSKATVRNVSAIDGRYRTGIQFLNLQEDYEAFIIGLISSKSYKSD